MFRKCFPEQVAPGEPPPARLQWPVGGPSASGRHLPISEPPQASLLAPLLLLLPGCSKEFPAGKTPPCAVPGAPLPPFPHSTHILPVNLNCPPPVVPLLQCVAKLQKTIRSSFGSFLPFQSRTALRAPLSFPGSGRGVLVKL